MLRRVARWAQAMNATESARLGLRRESTSEGTWFPEVVAGLYLLNPISLLSCGALCTDVFTTLLIVATLFGVSFGSAFMCAVPLAAAVYTSLYPAPLLIPVCIMLASKHKSTRQRVSEVVRTAVFFAATLAGLCYASWAVEGHSLEWVGGAYGFLLTAPDRTPNIGLWWYLFLELFTFYEPFFTAVFQLNVLVAAAVPLAVRFSSHPLVVYWAMCGVIAVFSPYPSLAAVGLHFALLPLVWAKVRKSGYTFVLVITAAALVVLLPNATRAWLYLGTGNVNFYYFGTLALQTVQVLFISDCLSKVVIRDFLIKRKIGEFSYLNNNSNNNNNNSEDKK